MPEVERGYTLIPVEKLIREPGRVEVFAALSRNEKCKCFIVDTPFIATVEVGGFTVDQVVGIGSIVCTPECGIDTGYRIAAPTWGYGRFIEGECIIAGEFEGYTLLRMMKYDVTSSNNINNVVDNVLRRGAKAIIYLPAFRDHLEVNRYDGKCGRLYTFNPLHPAGAFGKPRHTTCLNEIYELVGPLEKYLSPLLAVEDKPFLHVMSGMGEALVIGTNIEDLDAITSAAVWLGILYTCGREA